MKKRTPSVLLSLLLCCLLLFSQSFALNSSAVAPVTHDVISWQDTCQYTDGDVTGTYNDFSGLTYGYFDYNGVNYSRITIPNSSVSQCRHVLYTTTGMFSLRPNIDYNLKFNYFCGGQQLSSASFYWIYTTITCYVLLYNNDGTLVDTVQVHKSYARYHMQNILTVDTNFSLTPEQLKTGYTAKIKISVSKDYMTQDATEMNYFFSPVVLSDNNDNSGLLNSILNGLSVIWGKICDVNDSISSGLSGLGTRISGFFDNINNNIGTWFDEQKAKIQAFNDNVNTWLTDVKNGITDKVESIKNSIELKIQAATDEIKSWFVPSDNYFETWTSDFRSWAESHLGFLYTAASLFSGFINSIKNIISSDTYAFVFPSVTIPLPSGDISLWSDTAVPMAAVLENSYMNAAYLLYKGMLSVLLGFALFKYSEKVYEKIMSN